MYFGPEKYKSIEKIEFNSSELLNFLESKKDRLDVYHRHVAVVTCYSNEHSEINPTESQKKFPFFMNLLVTPSNEKLIGLSISNPMSTNPAIYKLQKMKDEENFKEKFKNFTNENCNLQCGIIKLPLKTRFVAIAGSDEFLKKEIFSEKVLGTESFSFAQKVDEKIIERLEKYKEGKFKICKTIINDEGINFFVIDRSVSDEFRPLLSEVVSLLRKKHNLSPAKYFALNEKVIGSFTLDFNTIFSENPFVQVEKLIEEYEMIKKDLIRHFV
ncbi:DUF4895 domain-containing protein [Fervidobacterium nodosum]|uniref:DUF4895 domain-containing protein n=1 Tax=Fervidobacterium nodosum (strain ATCC 35602 / DSM 5306 / Rt17-B1) TaxID=381764 RepID=A7HN20_FERNB|nr:DUF4895 domain-containing protein [Fervidobacterium nodosum]ABS61303.1 hypothetical protein Fnod_1460 [Fervidobacterium nodosum Rt17-B1]